MDFKLFIEKELKKHFKLKEFPIEVPKDSKMGDFAFPCFVLAKEFKKNPVEIAKELAGKIKQGKYISEVKAIGPYLNFFVNKQLLSENTLRKINKEQEKYGEQKLEAQKIVIEYPAPNTNKPLHLGHVRNMVLGYSISKLLRAIGNKVHEVDLVNDRGVHICKSMLAYKKWGKNEKPKIKTDHFVGKYYVKFAQEAKKNPQLETEAQDMLNAWEKGDKETLQLWKKMRNWALKGFDETFKTFDIKNEQVYFESEIYTKGKELVLKAHKAKKLSEKDGAIVAELEQYKIPDKILLRSDGTALYMTQDIYLAQKKIEDFKADFSIYVVGNEQNLHFRQLFKILELLGNKWAKKCYHLSYGMVNLPEGKMKSREGTVVDADDLVKEIVELAKKEIKARHKLKKIELERRAFQIGMGALRFYLLKSDPVKDITYNPKESISFEGETGPYVQYAHARCCSILEKYGKKVSANVSFDLLIEEAEQKVITLLENFSSVIEDSAKHHKPSILAHYLIELTQSFNEMYHNCQVISDGKELTKARILIVDCVRQVLENGLLLLGIEAPRQM